MHGEQPETDAQVQNYAYLGLVVGNNLILSSPEFPVRVDYPPTRFGQVIKSPVIWRGVTFCIQVTRIRVGLRPFLTVGVFYRLFKKKTRKKYLMQNSPRIIRVFFTAAHVFFRRVREGGVPKVLSAGVCCMLNLASPYEAARAHTMLGEPLLLQGRNDYSDMLLTVLRSTPKATTKYSSIVQNAAIYHQRLTTKRHTRQHKREAKERVQ